MSGTAEMLAAIDSAVDGRCACGCGQVLDPDGPSAWFAGEACQRRHFTQRATRPHDVYDRPDAGPWEHNDTPYGILVAHLAGADTPEPRVVVTSADPEVRATPELVRSWLTGNARGSVDDGDVVRLGTEGEGIGVVYYRITGDIPPDDGTTEGQGGSWVTLRRVA